MRGRRARLDFNQMKNNKKVIPYIPTFDFSLRKWPYLAYKVLKPYAR